MVTAFSVQSYLQKMSNLIVETNISVLNFQKMWELISKISILEPSFSCSKLFSENAETKISVSVCFIFTYKIIPLYLICSFFGILIDFKFI